jgi:hypothetical protein
MSERTAQSLRCSCDVALESGLGQACNEEAFRHFLAVERKRARRSGRSCLLLLVRVKSRRRMPARLDSNIAERLFACLWVSLRETDQVGWFRDGRIAGALLAGFAGESAAGLVCEKVRGSLHASLPPDVVRRLDVRAFRLPSRSEGPS